MKESPIFIKTYDLLLWIQNHVGRYPKHERFRLARIEDVAYEFYDQILRAALAENGTINLDEADILLRKLIILCRISKDNAYMTNSQYLFASEKLVELGKMINTWRKKEKQPA